MPSPVFLPPRNERTGLKASAPSARAAAAPGVRALLAAVLSSACLLAALPAAAEKADRSKPIQADADKLTLDNATKVSVFEGNVVIVQGTLRITADKVTLREEKDGSRQATGIGITRQATFRQKRDGVDEYVDGSADRFEYDGRDDRLELFGHANLKRGLDDIRGEYISYDTRTEFFRVNGSVAADGKPAAGSGRVHVTLQPASAPEAPGAPLNLKSDGGSSGPSP